MGPLADEDTWVLRQQSEPMPHEGILFPEYDRDEGRGVYEFIACSLALCASSFFPSFCRTLE